MFAKGQHFCWGQKIFTSRLGLIYWLKSSIFYFFNPKNLDIRNKQAYNAGHIIDAINIPVDNLEKELKKINKHKSKKLIIVCQAGADAHKAVRVLKINGFKQLFSLKGGVKLWEESNLPLEHKGK